MGDGDSPPGKRERIRRLGAVADVWKADETQADVEAAAMAAAVAPTAEGAGADESERYRGRRRLIERGSPRARRLFVAGLAVTLAAAVALPVLLLMSSWHSPAPAGVTPTWSDATFEPVIGGETPSTGASPSTAPATNGPPGAVTYQAESRTNTLTGSARIATYEGASGGQVVRDIGIRPGRRAEGTLRFTAVTAPTAGTYAVTIYYVIVDKSSTATIVVTVDGAAPRIIQLSGGRTCCASRTVSVTLAQGRNTIVFGNPDGHAPAIDRIVVARS